MVNNEQDSGSSAFDLLTYGVNGLSFGSDAALTNFLRRAQLTVTQTLLETVIKTPETIGNVLRPNFERLAEETVRSREADEERHVGAMAHAEVMTNNIVMAVQQATQSIIEAGSIEHQETRRKIEEVMNNAVMALCFTVQKATDRAISAQLTSPTQALLKLLNKNDKKFTIEHVVEVREERAPRETYFNPADLELIGLFLSPGGAELFIRNTIENPETLLLFLEVKTEDEDWKKAKYWAFQKLLELAFEDIQRDDPDNQMKIASVEDLLLLLVHAPKYEKNINAILTKRGETKTYREKVYETLRSVAYGEISEFDTNEQTQAELILHSAGQLSEKEKAGIELAIKFAKQL